MQSRRWEAEREWYIHGKRHRNAADGPAIVFNNNHDKDMYFENGVLLKKRKSINQKLSEVDAEIKKLMARKQKLLDTNPAERSKEDLTPTKPVRRQRRYIGPGGSLTGGPKKQKASSGRTL